MNYYNWGGSPHLNTFLAKLKTKLWQFVTSSVGSLVTDVDSTERQASRNNIFHTHPLRNTCWNTFSPVPAAEASLHVIINVPHSLCTKGDTVWSSRETQEQTCNKGDRKHFQRQEILLPWFSHFANLYGLAERWSAAWWSISDIHSRE